MWTLGIQGSYCLVRKAKTKGPRALGYETLGGTAVLQLKLLSVNSSYNFGVTCT